VTALRLGTFDAERWWRPADLATLPAGPPGDASAIAHADGVLGACCAPGDVLVTRSPMAPAVREHLAAAGISFTHHWLADSAPTGTAERAVLDDPAFPALAAGCTELSPYAVLPDTGELATRLGQASQLPAPSVVARVNSKVWSSRLVERLGLPHAGRVVRSVDELDSAVSEYGVVVVAKDPYGVSGRGTLEVATPRVLAAVGRTLRRQAEAGQRIELVVQPKLDRRCDFSAHFVLDRDGRQVWRGVVAMDNRGFRHIGSGPAAPALRHRLVASDYRRSLDGVADALAEAGYWGPVGVDSMLLADDKLVPVLEINARQSMGSLVLDLAARLPGRIDCHLRQLDVRVPSETGVDDLLAALRADRALYTDGQPAGILLLPGGSLAGSTGRLHFLVMCAPDQLDTWLARMSVAVVRAGIRPYGGVHAA
jgi:hypothetical protein